MARARKTIADRRAAAMAELEAAKEKLAKVESAAAERIGRLAIKAGLVDLDLTDEQLSAEFDAIASKFRGGEAVGGAASQAQGSEG